MLNCRKLGRVTFRQVEPDVVEDGEVMRVGSLRAFLDNLNTIPLANREVLVAGAVEAKGGLEDAALCVLC